MGQAGFEPATGHCNFRDLQESIDERTQKSANSRSKTAPVFCANLEESQVNGSPNFPRPSAPYTRPEVFSIGHQSKRASRNRLAHLALTN